MLTQEEKDTFLEELRDLIDSDFTGLDVCIFIRDNYLAQRLLNEIDFIDYSNDIDYILEHSESEIEYILDSPHSVFYDPDYGSQDPLCGFRISKRDEDREWVLNFENLEECDNVLSHILYALNEEQIEIPLDEVLTRENLSKLVDEDANYDCAAQQIYYFEKEGYDKLYFAHYFKEKNIWDCIEYKFDFDDPLRFVKQYLADEPSGEIAECRFFYNMENAYREYLPKDEQYKPLRKAVYNGPAAIESLKEKMYCFVKGCCRILDKQLEKRNE